ncbi:MAG: hypothetical protein GEV11_20555 [Streptosporangiales bacterium]|nr:hypothetical protein [Streptosporangiales bacterium]
MAGPIRRLRSYLGLDRNPLRRRRDRVEARIRLVLAAVLVLGGPALTLWSSGRVHDDLMARARAQQAEHRQVTAVVSAPREHPISELDGGRQTVVDATVALPSGGHKKVRIAVPDGTAPGDTVTIWMDGHDAVVQRPLTADDAHWTAVFTAMVIPLLLAMAVCGAASGVRALCMRRAEHDWERDWALADIQWRGHPPR